MPAEPAGLPEYLPRSAEAGVWTLAEFARLSPESLEQAVPVEEARRIRAFGVKGAVSASYRWETAGQEAAASIVAFEAASAEDAYGLTTCASSSAVTERCGGLTRVDAGPGLRMATWQGRMALRASTPSADTAAGTELRRLVQEIVSRIPREDAPDLLQAVPTASQIPGRQWIVRHLTSLPPTAFPPGRTPDLGHLSRLLGLDGGTLVFVSAHRVPRTDAANVVWIVRYGAADHARQAHDRLNAFLGTEAGSSAAWQRVTAAPPRGRFLVGTWTAEEESLRHLIPRVLELLPS